ncbi:MAG: hypothetical protein KBC64_02705 [Simkaniaceae bacterium]|nr:hypothetical protein [Simkaniaceae bacterium]
MSHRVVRFNRFLIVFNIVILGIFAAYVATDYLSDSVVAQKITLKGPKGEVLLELGAQQEGGVIAFFDQRGVVRLQLQGGNTPAVMLSGPDQTLIGTFFTLQDGGAAVGLGDQSGDIATFVRGGSSPNIAFYQNSPEPNLALGISGSVPHFVLMPKTKQEKLLIHGGSPASLLFVNENGDIPLVLSKYGLNQNKEVNLSSFSFEQVDKQSLQDLTFQPRILSGAH